MQPRHGPYTRLHASAVMGGQLRKRKPNLLWAVLCTDSATIGQLRSTAFRPTWWMRGAGGVRGGPAPLRAGHARPSVLRGGGGGRTRRRGPRARLASLLARWLTS